MAEFLYQIQDGTFGYSKAATHVISVKCTPIHASVMYPPLTQRGKRYKNPNSGLSVPQARRGKTGYRLLSAGGARS